MKSIKRCIAVLPFAFAIHNIEEALCIHKIQNPVFDMPLYSQNQFIIAVSFFTVLGFILVFGKRLYRNESGYRYATTGFVYTPFTFQ